MNFTPDAKIQQIAEAYSLDACDFLRDHFRIALDWTDASIQYIESVMDTFHRQPAKARPSPEQVMQFAKHSAAKSEKCIARITVQRGCWNSKR